MRLQSPRQWFPDQWRTSDSTSIMIICVNWAWAARSVMTVANTPLRLHRFHQVKRLRRVIGCRGMIPDQPIAPNENVRRENSLPDCFPIRLHPLSPLRSSTLGLPRDFGKERPQPRDLRFRQPVKFAHDPSPIWQLESRREPSFKWIYGSCSSVRTHIQNMTTAAKAQADMKMSAHRS